MCAYAHALHITKTIYTTYTYYTYTLYNIDNYLPPLENPTPSHKPLEQGALYGIQRLAPPPNFPWAKQTAQ